ncbi:phospholipase A2 inhibitor and Ly6/PLAUR domain-containing protein-like isoform X1 [Podarcis raffonei]|uniref:phospholipase A2 inhibitor and Ly6/PLAUR domain-containing protein-like isoform X1 n=1 Tax=Podarcis raffonei TaxID=65483 RepID=UPI002329232D|nr:phospholipase A2 inhibitor and Ly6/PLAUR domain-containing protein-like isoform X1 [Podarcis raffonei]XP_053253998.1 phospholipase A2 inhibitor and Ly6/PLAUR domain-containing protein-like isoform X1 [Podarcis raffonei]XP_053253999.1 phospholipase A2 inhibitor and Ly6/PLAUR domain-containing protein-like isoform X1 [Podarcis raffonei]XP_053254000.1 phospholipase A2 inhibitor and Ly6/PLAUR domain-containing protein-like isoform X1 [Podarcis raffonei]XP_053254001.1 phospholipase A2 inhibitor a
MKTILFHCLTCCILLLPINEARNLSCAKCDLGEATCKMIHCPHKELVCVTLSTFNTLGGGISPTGMYKSCINRSACKPGAFTLSTSTERQIRSNIACCGTAGCNEELVLSMTPASSTKNGLTCPGCESFNRGPCQAHERVECTGIEEKCISLVGLYAGLPEQNFSVKGCATDSACSLDVNDLVPYAGKLYIVTEYAVCTDGQTEDYGPSAAIQLTGSPFVNVIAFLSFSVFASSPV